MAKYLRVMNNSIQENLSYRASNFSFIFSQFLVFGMFFYLYASIYRQGGQIGGYTLTQMIFYYLAVNFLNVAFGGFDIAKKVGDDIRLGNINNFLTKPVSYFKYQLSGTIGDVIYGGFIGMITIAVLVWIVGAYFGFPFGLNNLIFFLLSATLGFLVDYLIFYIIGISTFWFGFVMGLNSTVATISSFLSGGFIPLDLLPSQLVAINNWLPFKYIVFTPISILNGRLVPSPELFLTPIAWIILLYLLSKLLFKSGIKKYDGFGA